MSGSDQNYPWHSENYVTVYGGVRESLMKDLNLNYNLKDSDQVHDRQRKKHEKGYRG